MSKTLPLTAFERCMMLDDDDSYPCVCSARLVLEGDLDRKSFESALLASIKDHWLLRAKVSTGFRPRWVIQEPTLPPVQWCQEATGGPPPPARRFNLHTETGLRLVVVHSNTRAEITFQFHHACCDGAGIERFSEDLVCHYAAFHAGNETASTATLVDPLRLNARGKYGLTKRNLISILPKQIVGLLGAIQFYFRSPKPITIGRQANTTDSGNQSFSASTALRVSREHTIAIRKAARSRKVSQNELLTRDFFLAIWEWQKQRKLHDADAWIRLMVPMNMRDASFRTLPAMNSVSSVFIDRRAADSADDEQLLNSIHDEMSVIHKYDLRYTFLISIGLMAWIPGALRRSVRRDQCDMSAIFTNTGKFFRRCPLPRIDGRIQAGNVSVVGADGLAPVRRHASIALCALEYQNRFKFNLHYDPRMLTGEEAEELIQLFHQQTLRSIAV